MSDYNFNVFGADTDSIIFCKQDMTPFSIEEQYSLINEINSLLPEKITFSHDGYFPTVLYFKAKNYVMETESGKIKAKGSALKDSKKEIALKEFMQEVIGCLLKTADHEEIQQIYFKYIMEVKNGLTDIKRWCSKKTLTEKIWSSPRENEAKVLRAIQGTEYKEADKVWVYFKEDGELNLMENFDGYYDKMKLYEKLFKTSQFFNSVLPKDLFLNYKLKKNYEILDPSSVKPKKPKKLTKKQQVELVNETN
jgi:hypothetical protein